MTKDSLLLNLADPAIKQELLAQIRQLSGLYEISIRPRTRTRSLDQNAYYWAAVVQPFTEWLRENYGDSRMTKEQAHEMLKVKILGLTEKQIPDSPETITVIPQSHTLTTEEFSDYIENCAAWLAEFCSIVVMSAETFYEQAKAG